MSVELATAFVQLVPSAKGIGAAVASELAPVEGAAAATGAASGSKLSGGLLASVAGTGGRLIGALGIAGVGVAAFHAAEDVESAENTIIRSTGATGKAADGLVDSFKNIARQSPASFSTIAAALSDVYARTGLTGTGLEGLTGQIVTFNRITKDSPITVDELTKSLAGFNVPAADMGKVLDQLFVTSQKTGVPLAELIGTLNTAGPIARQFGFSVQFTAGLLSQLNRAGIDASSIMPGLRKAFIGFAKAGEDPAAALKDVIGSIDELVKKGDIIGAQGLAVKVFGARGAGLVDAAVQGKLSLQSLSETFDTTGAGILDTGSKTSTLAGKLGILKNNAKLALAEFGTPILKSATGLLAGMLPVVQGLGSVFAALPAPVRTFGVGIVGLAVGAKLLSKPIGAVVDGFKLLGGIGPKIISGFGAIASAAQSLWAVLLANPFILIAVAVIAVVVLIILNWDKVKAFLIATWEAIKSAAAAAWNWIKDFFVRWWPLILGIFTGGLGLVVGLIIQNWSAIRDFTVGIFNSVVDFFAGLPGRIWGAIVALVGLVFDVFSSAMNGALNAVIGGAGAVIGFVAGIPGAIVGAIGDLGGLLFNAGASLLEGLIDGARSVLGDVESFFSGIADDLTSWKGPPEKDAVLLVPAGKLIMRSLVAGADSELAGVKSFFTGPATDAIRLGNVGTFTPQTTPAGAAAAGGSSSPTGRGAPLIHIEKFYGTPENIEQLGTRLERVLQREDERRLRAHGRQVTPR